jgi:hypothetical protein
MTVCIAAFAAKSKAIVLVSDKMLTYGDYNAIQMQSDTGVRKLLHLGDSGWEIQFAGDGAFAEKVVYQATQAYEKKPTIRDSCAEIMDCMQDAYRAVREREAHDAILRPRMLDRDLVFKRHSSELHPLSDELVAELTKELKAFQTGCILLVCGFDKSGPHMFTLDDPGIFSSCDLPGFCAIGIGHEAATSRLLWEDVDRNNPLDLVLYDVFHAKVQAEIIVGVGYTWDAHIIVRGKKLTEVKRPVIHAIEELFEDLTLSPFDKSKRRSEAHKKWIALVSEFAKRALEPAAGPAKRKKKARLIALTSRGAKSD